MDLPTLLRRHAWWLLLVVLLAAVGAFGARVVAEARARADALSAELLAAPDEGAFGAVADPYPVHAEATPDPVPAGDPAPPGVGAAPSSDTLSGTTPGVEGAGEREGEPEAPALDPALFADWTTFDAAVEQSRASGRPVLLAFSAPDCELCDALERDVFRAEAPGVTVRSAVIPVSVRDPLVGGREAREVEELEHRFAVSTFPTLILYDPVTGHQQRLRGYPGTARTLRWITSGLPGR